MTGTKLVGRLSRSEFIALVAALIAINAFAIDVMLPGLQQIGAGLGEPDANRRQLVIPAYMLGFGLLQMVFGPLSDRYGRRGPLLIGLCLYCIAALSAFLVHDFNSLILLRFLQGAGAASSAVVAMALIRDLFTGDEMAKIMSLVFMVLMLSPIFAPGFGQLLLMVMDWRGLFMFMAGLGMLVTLWVWWRLPETLKPENRRPVGFKSFIDGFGIVFSNHVSLTYILATALLFGALMGFVTSSQQIYTITYGVGLWFPAFFAAGGAISAIGGFANSQLVTKYGMRRLSHAALFGFIAAMGTMAVLGWLDLLPLALFFALSAATFFSFNFIMPNFGALALEPLGEVAGTAASAQGVLQMVIGAAIGGFIGQKFDGTALPLAVGTVLLSLGALVLVNLKRAKAVTA